MFFKAIQEKYLVHNFNSVDTFVERPQSIKLAGFGTWERENACQS
jgi:hypothetical protein